MRYPIDIILHWLAYQDAFFTPGIFPCRAISRKITLEIPKYRIYPLGRPVS